MSVRLAAAVALATAAIAPASAIANDTSSVTIYGVLDLGIDQTTKGEGDVQGTIFGVSGTTPLPNSVAAREQKLSRLSSSLSSQSLFGFRGTEDLGGGYKAGFQLEGTLVPDVGAVANDNRFFGRVAMVSLTTPYGELRFGRQASPMLAAYSLATTERLGTTDVMGAGLVVNNIQSRWDNMVGYIARTGPWLVFAGASPNAGVAERISAVRQPVANATSGQILGGATAGTESSDHRGFAHAAMVAYQTQQVTATAVYHYNRFTAPIGFGSPTSFTPLFNADSYTSFMVGGKYTVPTWGTTFGANFFSGTFEEAAEVDPEVRAVTLGVKHQMGALALGVQGASWEFTNFTRGKNKAFMFNADYDMSKRTALYSRIGVVEDDRGDVVRTPVTPVPVAGGPASLLVPFGTHEVPLFSAAGLNIGGKTTIVSVGLRHSF